MSELYLDIEIERSATAKDKKQYIKGYATTVDLGSEGFIITREAIAKSTDDLLRRSTVLLNHDQNRPIGKVVTAEGRDNGLFVEAFISKSEPEIWAKIQEGVLNKFSVRGKVLNSYEEFDNDVNQKVLYITRMELQEVSVVSVPAVPQAEILEWVERKHTNKEVTELAKKDEEKKDTLETKVAEVKTSTEASEVKEPTKEDEIKTSAVEETPKEEAKAPSDFLAALNEMKSSLETQIQGIADRVSSFEEVIAGVTIEEDDLLGDGTKEADEITASASEATGEEIVSNLTDEEKGMIEAAVALVEELEGSSTEDQQAGFSKLREVLTSLGSASDSEYPTPDAEGLPPATEIAASTTTADFTRAMDETMSKLSTNLDTLAKAVLAIDKKVEKLPIYRGSAAPAATGTPVQKLMSTEEFKKKAPYEQLREVIEHVTG